MVLIHSIVYKGFAFVVQHGLQKGLITTDMGDDMDLAIHEFLDLTRRFPHWSRPVCREVADFMKSISIKVRQNGRQPYVEDDTNSDVEQEGNG